MATGITTRAVATELHKEMVKLYEEELSRLPIKKSVREVLVDGYRDGFRQAIQRLAHMQIIEFVEEPKQGEGEVSK